MEPLPAILVSRRGRRYVRIEVSRTNEADTENTMTRLTPEACRAGRAILKWSVRDLAEQAGIAFSTVHLLERGESVREDTRAKIAAAFAAHDVEIIDADGTGAILRRHYTEEEGLRPDQLSAANDD